MIYQGRFAPSPTGPLHLGSLVTAVGSFLQARQQNGKWYVRIEDIDTPRVVIGAAQAILSTLSRFGMPWDGEVLFQSQRISAYQDILADFQAKQLVYPCTCSRKQIAGKIYHGHCRQRVLKDEKRYAWRVRTDVNPLSFEDEIQGKFSGCLETEVGDFIIKRSDGLFAYQLVVVADDARQNITHIARGADLLDTTLRQIYLQQLLNCPTPNYTHFPVILNEYAHKLSKQTFAPPIDHLPPVPLLVQVFSLLGQAIPPELTQVNLQTFWDWAIQHWDIQKVPKVPSIQINTDVTLGTAPII